MAAQDPPGPPGSPKGPDVPAWEAAGTLQWPGCDGPGPAAAVLRLTRRYNGIGWLRLPAGSPPAGRVPQAAAPAGAILQTPGPRLGYAAGGAGNFGQMSMIMITGIRESAV